MAIDVFLQIFEFLLSTFPTLLLASVGELDVSIPILTVPLDLLSVVASPPPPFPPPIVTTQQALLVLSDQFPTSNLFDGWNDTVSECEYPGVVCDEMDEVTSVVLEDVTTMEDENVPASLIETILELAPNLEVLVITNANIEGEVPTEWPESLEVIASLFLPCGGGGACERIAEAAEL